MVRKLLSAHPEFINLFDDLACTPLHNACRDGRIYVAKYLIQQGADVNAHYEFAIGDTPLGTVVKFCKKNQVKLVRTLLDAGANPNIPTWMWLTVIDEAVEEIDESEETDLALLERMRMWREIYAMLVEKAKDFPVPVYPNGKSPEKWPPLPKNL